MKLYLVSQSENNDYDTYDSFVACAPDEETARNMDPCGGGPMNWGKGRYSSWCSSSSSVKVELIGEANPDVKQGVVCSSFNAG